MSFEDDILREKEAIDALEAMRVHLQMIWKWGDGDGGYVYEKLRTMADEEGLRTLAERIPAQYKKAVISRYLAREVMERDAYRCVQCGTHFNLTCDHIVPESKGGETTFDNLQTMCRSCNSKKGARG